MKALVHHHTAQHALRIADVPHPVSAPSQALIQVAAFSFNRGEVAFRSPNLADGTIPGWDAAGIVVTAATDGSGPQVGSRVVTFGWCGGWAEFRAVDTDQLALVPDGIDLGTAAALPVAAGTALQAVRRLGPLSGKRVLITGASGGVGRYAVQLAHLEGAHVIASIGDPVHDLGLHELGAAEIVIGPAAVDGGVDGVIDNVGGRQLADAYTLLTDGGLIIAVGKASEEPTTIDFEAARVRHDRGGIETFNVQVPLGDDLEQLVRLVDEQRLAISIGWRGDWLRYEQAIDALIGRNVMGKVVLDIHTSA